MNEIEVRGKEKKTGKWVYGGFFKPSPSDIDYAIIWEGRKDGGYGVLRSFVDPETVGLFTGLYDCTKWAELTDEERQAWWNEAGKTPEDWKGRKIFKGDIVQVDYFDTPAVVEYYQGSFITSGLFLAETYGETMRVVGNIYDNSEMVTAKVGIRKQDDTQGLKDAAE